jgi:hypothetical protein
MLNVGVTQDLKNRIMRLMENTVVMNK